jgi:hypothetical protein
MFAQAWLQIILTLLPIFLISILLGRYMARIVIGQPTKLDRIFDPVDNAIYFLIGRVHRTSDDVADVSDSHARPVQSAKLGRKEELAALKRLDDQARLVERHTSDRPVEALIAEERRLSHSYAGRSVSDGSFLPRIAPPIARWATQAPARSRSETL